VLFLLLTFGRDITVVCFSSFGLDQVLGFQRGDNCICVSLVIVKDKNGNLHAGLFSLLVVEQ